MLDSDLADLYRIETRALIQAVRRNKNRFPGDFMFQLNNQEFANLRSQFVISRGHGGRRVAPYAFTEQGVAMLSSVLRSDRAAVVNVEIIRAFVRLRRLLIENEELGRKLTELERKYDERFKAVFEAIRELMRRPDQAPKRPIGFTSWREDS